MTHLPLGGRTIQMYKAATVGSIAMSAARVSVMLPLMKTLTTRL